MSGPEFTNVVLAWTFDVDTNTATVTRDDADCRVTFTITRDKGWWIAREVGVPEPREVITGSWAHMVARITDGRIGIDPWKTGDAA